MKFPNQKEMELNMMQGKGKLGVQRIAKSQNIPKMSEAPTRTTNGKSNHEGVMKKKMQKIMKHISKGA